MSFSTGITPGLGLPVPTAFCTLLVALNGGAMQAVQDALDVTCETVKTLQATVTAVTAAVISAAVGLPLRFIVLFRGRRIFLRQRCRRNAYQRCGAAVQRCVGAGSLQS